MHHILYYSVANAAKQVKRVSLSGGVPEPVTDGVLADNRKLVVGGKWLVLGQGLPSTLYAVAKTGGTPHLLYSGGPDARVYYRRLPIQ